MSGLHPQSNRIGMSVMGSTHQYLKKKNKNKWFQCSSKDGNWYSKHEMCSQDTGNTLNWFSGKSSPVLSLPPAWTLQCTKSSQRWWGWSLRRQPREHWLLTQCASLLTKNILKMILKLILRFLKRIKLQHQSFQWILRTDFLYDGLVWLPCSPRDSSRVSSNTTVQKHHFFRAQLSLQSNSHIHTWLLEKP